MSSPVFNRGDRAPKLVQKQCRTVRSVAATKGPLRPSQIRVNTLFAFLLQLPRHSEAHIPRSVLRRIVCGLFFGRNVLRRWFGRRGICRAISCALRLQIGCRR